MIEFKGHISDKIYKRLRRKERIFFGITLAVGCLLISPFWFALAVGGKAPNPILLGTVASLVTLFGTLLAIFIPPSKKTKEEITFYHVFFDGEIIVAKQGIDKEETCRDINDAKCVKDYGDYYEVVYKLINPFICQKDLISGGTLEEFEAMFEGKIERVG